TSLATPPGVRRIDVQSALEMRDAVLAEFEEATITVMAAAVADFRAAQPSGLKIKKEDLADDSGLTLELTRNPDILAELCERKGERLVIGFAAESHDLMASARRKIARKGCDLLVANNVSSETSGFDADDNAVVFVWPDGQVEELPTLPKKQVAAQLFDRIAKSRGGRE
ncbi:MAG TPA: phosphopantothenoylcysteine decarboxylase, partial [Myxococcota bacterium]